MATGFGSVTVPLPGLAGPAPVLAGPHFVFSHSRRGELRAGGVRVVHLFTGPTDDEWFQPLPPPKVTADQIARAAVDALQRGLEDVYVGDVAQDLRARLELNPKALERELGS